MRNRLALHRRRSDWQLVLLAAAVLAVYIYFSWLYVFDAPYPGFDFTTTSSGWLVVDSSLSEIKIDDMLVGINGLSYREFQQDRTRLPFGESNAGDIITVEKSGGEFRSIMIPEPTLGGMMRRAVSLIAFFPFWLAGTLVLLFLWPRDNRWRLLVGFMYLIAIFVIAGGVSGWRVGASRLVFGAAVWLALPVSLHLHLVVPTDLFARTGRIVLPIYILAAVGATLELLSLMPRSGTEMGIFLFIAGSLTLLLFRYFSRRKVSADRVASQLMMAGIGLAFGPGVLLLTLPSWLGNVEENVGFVAFSFITVPVMPLFYVYAIYKRQLGHLEFRTNRLLSLYSFILIFPPIFLAVFLLGQRTITSGGARTIYSLVTIILFLIAAPPLLGRFQKWVNRFAYGTEHDPDTVIRVFAQQIPSSLQRESLASLLTSEILPSLLIRESALFLLEGQRVVPLYEQPADRFTSEALIGQLAALHERLGVYQPPNLQDRSPLAWVRLALPLRTREEVNGVWLFGRRDPDDFYPRADIDLLQTLANQIAPVIENIRLYEALQRQADSLADEVARRTGELREERDRTQAILDSAGEGVFFADPAGAILYSNPAMSALTGFAADEILGQQLTGWLRAPGDALPDRLDSLLEAITRGSGWSGELVHRRRDGSETDVSLTLAPLYAESGELGGFVGVQSDISKAKEVDRLKSNIISNVSHELKTPLTNIKTYLTLLQRGRPEKAATYMSVLERETNRLARLITDLLDLSQLDSGQVPLDIKPLALVDLINEVMGRYQPLAQNQQIKLHNLVSPELPAVHADHQQMEQVLTNLLVNAINYTPAGGRVTFIADYARQNEEAIVRLHVQDTGRGIPQDELPRLFDRFYRGQSSQESAIPGNGLGLAICREIVHRHQGRIEVTSELGRGSTFTICLPAEATADWVATGG